MRSSRDGERECARFAVTAGQDAGRRERQPGRRAPAVTATDGAGASSPVMTYPKDAASPPIMSGASRAMVGEHAALERSNEPECMRSD